MEAVPAPAPLQDHEYHEISDEENNHSPTALDLGPSLMAEMEMMFNSLGKTDRSLDHEGSNRYVNEIGFSASSNINLHCYCYGIVQHFNFLFSEAMNYEKR